jgi:hypothetical protein
MRKDYKLRLLPMTILLVFYFSAGGNLASAGDDSRDREDNTFWICDEIAQIDSQNMTITFESPGDQKKFKITDETFDKTRNKKVSMDDSLDEILSRGAKMMAEYVVIDDDTYLIKHYWVFSEVPDKYDVKNFIYFQEINKSKIVKRYRLGEVYLEDINRSNQLKLLIDVGYLYSPQIYMDDKRIKIATSYDFVKRASDEFKGSLLLLDDKEKIYANSSIVYYIEDIGLVAGDKFKIEVSIEVKEDTKAGGEEKWKELSTNIIKFKIRRGGFRVHTHETLAFVRDSFSKSWEPHPGTSLTLGYTAYFTDRTGGFFKCIGKAWNLVGPRVGINLTLLDFDKDKNVEIGLGPVVSVLKGALYAGVGWNLSTSKAKDRYAFFGISLTEITTIIKGVISK